MKKTIDFFIRYPKMVNLGLFLIVLLGLISFSQVQYTLDPDEKPKKIFVDITLRGASPVEIEERIISRIEENLRGVNGVDRYTSVSGENTGRVTVELFETTDINEAITDVENAVNQVTDFPMGMESPVIYKQEMLSPAITLGITGDVPLQELKDYANLIRDDFILNGGMSKVHILGLPEEEIEIRISESELEAWGVTFDEIAGAVREANLDITGGELKTPEATWQIRARNLQNVAVDLQQIVLRADLEGGRMLLGEIAEVEDRFADRPIRRFVNNKEAVVIQVLTTDDEDLLAAASYAKEFVNEFNSNHSGVNLIVIDDFSAFIEERVASLWENGVFGLILVLIILTLFLDKRIAFWVAVTIPLAFLGTFILSAFGYSLSINVISIFGFILVLGMLVDTGVVVVENIYRHYNEFEKHPVLAARDGAGEVTMPMVTSLLTTAAAFSLFFFLPGRPGTFFTEISFVVISSLFMALVAAFLFLPAMLTRSKVLSAENRQYRWEIGCNLSLIRFRDRFFMPFWDYVTTGKKIAALGGFFLLFVFSLLTIRLGWLPVSFFPVLDDDIQLVQLELEPGTPADTTNRKLMRIEEAVKSVNRELTSQRDDDISIMKNVERVLGPNSHQGYLRVVLMGGDERKIPSFEINNMYREASGVVRGAEVLRFRGATAEERFGGMPVSISLNGDNLASLRNAATDLQKAMEKREDLIDIANNDNRGVPELHIRLTPAGEQLGLNLREVMNQVRAGFFGIQVQSLQRGDEEVRVWVRYSDRERSEYRNLEQMKIRTRDRGAYPLNEIAAIIPTEDLLHINRRNGRRQILVDADVANPTLSAPSIISDIEENILPGILDQYPGVSYEIEGQQREAERVVAMIKIAGPVILLLMFSLVVINFQSFSQTILVFCSLPFAIVGAVIGHFIHSVPFNIFSVLGIIAMIGILVNNMLVLLSAFNDNLKAGMYFDESMQDAVRSRFRPILLTTLSTIAGLTPMIFLGGLVSAFLQPPALSISYGLIFGLLITLVLMPVYLICWNRLKVYVNEKFRKLSVSPESVEPAVKQLEHQGRIGSQ